MDEVKIDENVRQKLREGNVLSVEGDRVFVSPRLKRIQFNIKGQDLTQEGLENLALELQALGLEVLYFVQGPCVPVKINAQSGAREFKRLGSMYAQA